MRAYSGISICDIGPGFIREFVKLICGIANIRNGKRPWNMAHTGSGSNRTRILPDCPGVNHDNAGVRLKQSVYLHGSQGAIYG